MLTEHFSCETMCYMTTDEHKHLYEELKEVLYDRTKTMDSLTAAQRHFVEAFELAAFGSDLLESYSDLIDKLPDITLRNLHSFCLGHALGTRNGENPELKIKTNFH